LTLVNAAPSSDLVLAVLSDHALEVVGVLPHNEHLLVLDLLGGCGHHLNFDVVFYFSLGLFFNVVLLKEH
jgi:hypothetical protein